MYLTFMKSTDSMKVGCAVYIVQALKELSLQQQKLVSLLEDDHTEKKPMSEATQTFSTELLNGLGLGWTIADSNQTHGQNYLFSWQGGEVKRTRQAIRKLQELLGDFSVTADERALQFVDVHSSSLVPLKANGKEANGQTDAVIRFSETLVDDQAHFAFVIGMVEFKTTQSDLKLYQQLLELVAMSRVSKYGQGVVLLGTDLNAKWQVCFFDMSNHITCQTFKHGSVALSFFRDKMCSVHQRAHNVLQLLSIPEGSLLHQAQEHDQNLSGFDTDTNSRVEAAQDLQLMVRIFQQHFGTEVVVPPWAYSPDVSHPSAGMYS
jgi:hypothetical protein